MTEKARMLRFVTRAHRRSAQNWARFMAAAREAHLRALLPEPAPTARMETQRPARPTPRRRALCDDE